MAPPVHSSNEISTARLTLVPRTLSDLDDCIRMDRDPEVTKYISGPWSDPEAHRAFVEARTLAAYPQGQGYWVIKPKSRPRSFLGWVLLIPLDGVGPETEVGWRLPRSEWGHGYATEAAAAVLTHGFMIGGLSEVVADIHPRNHNSQRVAEKLRFEFREMRMHHGEEHRRYGLSRTPQVLASLERLHGRR